MHQAAEMRSTKTVATSEIVLPTVRTTGIYISEHAQEGAQPLSIQGG